MAQATLSDTTHTSLKSTHPDSSNVTAAACSAGQACCCRCSDANSRYRSAASGSSGWPALCSLPAVHELAPDITPLQGVWNGGLGWSEIQTGIVMQQRHGGRNVSLLLQNLAVNAEAWGKDGSARGDDGDRRIKRGRK